MRAGDFSELLPGPTGDRQGSSEWHAVPREHHSHHSHQRGFLKVQDNYLPAPDQGGPHDQARNFGYLFPYPGDVRWWDSITGRIDHKISEKNTIHGRLSVNWGRTSATSIIRL